MNGTGTFYLWDPAFLTIDAANAKTIVDTAMIDNDGIVSYTAASAGPYYLEFDNGGGFANDGTFQLSTNAPVASNGVSSNAIKHGGVKSQWFSGSPAFHNESNGTVKKFGGGTTSFIP